MGILVKFYIEDSKKQLNVVVQDYDIASQECKKTMLDVMVPLVTKGDHVSDIDECTNDDLIVDSTHDNYGWNSTSDDLEKVLGEELGIEINNIMENAVPHAVVSITEKKDPPLLKNHQQEEGKEQVLNAPELLENEVGNNERSLEDNILEEITGDNDAIIVTLDETEMNEDVTNSTPEKFESDNPKNQSDSVIAEDSPKDVAQTSSRTTNTITTKSNPPSAERAKSKETSNICDELTEEIIDSDSYEEIDSWSVNDTSEASGSIRRGSKVVDLTEDRNVEHHANSVILNDDDVCNEQNEMITVVNDVSDDEDEISSQYSSGRRSLLRRRTKSVGTVSFNPDFNFPHRRAISNPPEDLIGTTYDDEIICESIFDDEEHENVPQVVDLTTDKNVVCIDLTNEKKSGTSTTVTSPSLVIRRSMSDVMNEIRNYYKSNKDAIAEKEEALAAYSDADTRKSGIEAPPKLSNGLNRSRCDEGRKRTSSPSDCEDCKVKISRAGAPDDDYWEGCRNFVSSRTTTVRSLVELPAQVCGPPGYRVTDDLGERPATTPLGGPASNEAAPPADGFENPIPSLFTWGANRRHRTAPRPLRGNYQFCYRRKTNRNRYSWRHNLSNHFNHNKSAFVKRGSARNDDSSRVVKPTPERGEVWLN